MKIIEMNKLILKRLKGRKFFVDHVIESLDWGNCIIFYHYICMDYHQKLLCIMRT